jgi:hypothetical protein
MFSLRDFVACNLLFILAPHYYWMRFRAFQSEFQVSPGLRPVTQGFPIFPEIHPLRIFYGKLDFWDAHNLPDFISLRIAFWEATQAKLVPPKPAARVLWLEQIGSQTSLP